MTQNLQPQPPEIAELLSEVGQANELWSKNDAAKGIPMYERLLPKIERGFGTNSAMAGRVLFRIGFLRATKGDFDKALPYLERSLKLVGSLPDDEPGLEIKGNLHWGLGISYKALLKLDEAMHAFEQALQFKESLKGKDDPELLATLNEIADLHYLQRNFASAVPLCERVLKISEKAFGQESEESARALALLGNTRAQLGQYEAAVPCLTRSLEIHEKILAPTNTEVASALINLGGVFGKTGDHDKAISFLERAVELVKATYLQTDQNSAFKFASALSGLGTALIEAGHYNRGLACLQRSIAVTEASFGAASINLAPALNSIAVTFHRQGEFERAFLTLDRAIRILDDAPPHKTPELVEALNNIAELYRDAGDGATAARLFGRSLETAEKQLGSDYISTAYSLNGLALISQHAGETVKALGFFERALSVLEKHKHPDVPSLLNNISALLNETGDTNRAFTMLQMALKIQGQAQSPDYPLLATILNNLAGHISRRGDYQKAKDLTKKSLAMTDLLFGKNNPNSCDRLANLGIIEILGGNQTEGFNELLESTRRWRFYLLGQITARTARRMFRLERQIRVSRDWFHSLCGAAQGNLLSQASTQGAQQLAFGKALVEEIEAVEAQLAADGRASLRELRTEADTVKDHLDALARSTKAAWLDERTNWQSSERDRLEQTLRTIEEKIAAANEQVKFALHDRDPSAVDLPRGLPAGAALIDLVQYSRTDFCCGDKQWKEERYAAYVTLPPSNDVPNGSIGRADLGEAAPINDAVDLVCRRMSVGQYSAKDLSDALQHLSRLVYAPLAKHLTNVSHLIVCPDGQLSRLPFEMLSNAGRFLIEDKVISYVGSGREIVRLSQPSAHANTNAPMVMGNPDFDFNVSRSSQAGGPSPSPSKDHQDLLASANTRSLSREYRGLKFTPLAGAEQESKSLAALLGAHCVLRLGKDAREAELKAVRSPCVLHLATHGFFLSDQEFRATNSWTPNLLQVNSIARSRENDWENPVIRCGVALAGANHATQITNAVAEDGILTGLEASLLNLQGTELVILSACDSGSGDVKIGEGVMSLRRAFRIAGAESVLASHWKVSDKATTQLMSEFMRRWRSGQPRAKAWREAQLYLLRSKDYSNPYFWAAFTLTGQWK